MIQNSNLFFFKYLNLQQNKKKPNNKQKPQTSLPKGRGLTLNTDNGYNLFKCYFQKICMYIFFRDVLASDMLENSLNITSETIFEQTIFEDTKGPEHQGQGDGPVIDATVTH